MAAHPLRILSLCAGVGMHDLGLGAAFSTRTVCYVEREAFAASQLVGLMEAGVLDQAPVWSDLTTFDARAWRGCVDGIVAGFPCQPWSAAGKREGTEDERWLWPAIARIVREIESPLCFLENVPGLVSGGGLEHVLFDLARCGLDAQWCHLSAAAVGASHERNRVWILGYEPTRGRGLLSQCLR